LDRDEELAKLIREQRADARNHERVHPNGTVSLDGRWNETENFSIYDRADTTAGGNGIPCPIHQYQSIYVNPNNGDSYCRICHKDWAMLKYRTDPDYRKKRNARAVEREREKRQDPAYAAKKREQYKEWRRKAYADPERGPKLRAKDAERKAKRYQNDPEYRAKVQARQKKWNQAHRDRDSARRKEKYDTDPEYRTKRLTQNAARWKERYQTDPVFREMVLANKRKGGKWHAES
jgi:hypothetical protein